jgi:hypothetical protein
MAIVIRFIGEAGNYIQAVDKAIKKTELFSKKSMDALRANTEAFAKWGTAVAGVAAVGAAAIIKASGDSAREIQNLSNIAGISAEEFQRQAFAASKAGIQTDKYSDIIKDVNDKLGDFMQTGAGPMVDFFEKVAPKVGVTADQFRNLSGPDALQLYVSSLEKANLSQADMTFYMEALASDSTALLPLLQDNGAAMAAFAEEADRLGIALSDVEVEQLSEMSNSVADLQKIFGSMTDKLAAEFAPLVTAVSQLLKESAIEASGLSKAAENSFNRIIEASAFVINAVDGIKRTFEIAGAGIIAWWAKIAQFISDRILAMVNAFNSIPLMIDIPTDGLEQFAAMAKGISQEAVADIGRIMEEPMAGDRFKQIVATAKQASEEAAQATVDAKKSAMSQKAQLNMEEEKLETEKDDREKERLAARLENLRASFLTESEQLTAKYAMEEELLRASLDRKLITEQEYKDLMLEAERKHGEAQAALIAKNEEKKTQIEEMSLASRAQMMTGELSQIASAFGTHSNKMNKIAQIAGATSALISTFQGQAEALKLPFPGNLIAAAKVGAAGFGFVQAIKNAGKGGGGSTPAAAGAAQSVQATPPPNTFNIAISGMNPNQMFSGGQFGDIITVINDRIRAGDRLVGISA